MVSGGGDLRKVTSTTSTSAGRQRQGRRLAADDVNALLAGCCEDARVGSLVRLYDDNARGGGRGGLLLLLSTSGVGQNLHFSHRLAALCRQRVLAVVAALVHLPTLEALLKSGRTGRISRRRRLQLMIRRRWWPKWPLLVTDGHQGLSGHARDHVQLRGGGSPAASATGGGKLLARGTLKQPNGLIGRRRGSGGVTGHRRARLQEDNRTLSGEDVPSGTGAAADANLLLLGNELLHRLLTLAQLDDICR